MTVADLIEKLREFPAEAEVVQFDDYGLHYGDPEPEMTELQGRSVVAF